MRGRVESGAGGEGLRPFLDKADKFSELVMGDMARALQLAEEQGLKQSSERLGIWVPKDQEDTGPIPSRFFTQTRNKEGGVLFEEHTFNFPIQNPDQLAESLDALGALYEADDTYDVVRDDREGFMKFVSGLAEPKQPKV